MSDEAKTTETPATTEIEVPHLPDLPDDELEDMFPSKAEAFRAGWHVGAADTKVGLVRMMNSISAYLQKSAGENFAFVGGDKTPLDH